MYMGYVQNLSIQSHQKKMAKDQQQETQHIEKENSQFKALFLKNAQLQSKQPCTNCCQIMTPVICLIFTYLIIKLSSDQLPKGNLYDDVTYPYVFGDFTKLDQNSLKVDNETFQRKPGEPSRNNPLQWYWVQCVDQCQQSTMLGNYDGSVAQTNPDGTTILGSIVNDKSVPFVGNVALDYYNNPVGVGKYIPFFMNTDNVNQELFTRGEKAQDSSYQTVKDGRKGMDTLADGAIIFHEITNNRLNVSFKINDDRELAFHRNNGVTNLRETRKLDEAPVWQQGKKEIRSPTGMLHLMDLVTQAYTFIRTGTTVQSGWIFTRDTEQTKSFIDSIVNTTCALLFPLALSLLFPVMLYTLVLEKEERLVQMMKMNGMKIRNYWLVYFIFNFALCLITNIVFFLIGAIMLDTEFFQKTNYLLIVIIVVGWSFAQIGMAAFFMTFLSKSRSANIIGYIVAIWTMMIGSTLNIGVYQVPSQFPGWLQATPPFAFNRLFYLMLMECSDANCYEVMGQVTPQMRGCILGLYLGGFILFLFGAYLLEVLPQQFGVSRHPLFPFIDFYKFVTCKKERSYSTPEKDKELKKYMSNDEEDPWSKEQRETISKMRQIDDSPLIINNLRKLYKKQGYTNMYPAVKSFNLKIHKNETFGLLGPNGAGKTTLISMLTGMTTPNHGNAWIGGYDINSSISRAQLEMGVCPQFDLLWPQLTIQQHLLFYARLKGIPSSKINNKVEEAIAEVNLTSFRNFLASSLSGGMKRRLSIAISLVGDPQIVFLDEPSTGLDPDNRRQIWDVLVKCQEKRSLFLTTHIMEQADALCHRIGIVTHGTLRTVGNQIRLKKDYGEGYRLSLSLATQEKKLISAQALGYLNNVNLDEHEDNQNDLRRSINELVGHEHEVEQQTVKKGLKRVEQYVLRQFKGASIARRIGQSLVFKVPESYKISDMFLNMHQAEKDLGVTNVSITQSSLEDVFIAVVLKYDKIVDDDETGEPKLVQFMQASVSSQTSSQAPMHTIEPVPKKVDSKDSDARYGSVLEKSRESVFSQEEMRREKKDSQDE